MTEEQREIKRLFFNGWRIKAIGEKIGLSESQVKDRIRAMRRKGIIVERWWKEREDK